MNNTKALKVKILVCCHKPDKWLSDDVYIPIHCGKAVSKVNLGIQGDDTGDNISTKNPNYCELTAMYWAWKNLKDCAITDAISISILKDWLSKKMNSWIPSDLTT